jgi:hypothetical protein
MMPADKQTGTAKRFGAVAKSGATKQEEQISELQEQLAQERDARMEDRFVFIVAVVILLDVVFFTVMPSFGGPLALLILQLLVLIPLAKRMGMQEVAQILSRVLHRMAGKSGGSE